MELGSAAISPAPSVRLKLAVPAGRRQLHDRPSERAAETGPRPARSRRFNTREPVQGGELLGLYLAGGCLRASRRDRLHGPHVPGNQAPGSHRRLRAPRPRPQLSVSAVLEPDADDDGYGDETQDCAPTDPSRNEDCTPPDTTITKGPKKKTKKKTATFDFTGTERAGWSRALECSLDGAEFVPCTSPRTVKVKKGKHTFSVRAADELNNIDATPATYSWKVKKKKRRSSRVSARG